MTGQGLYRSDENVTNWEQIFTGNEVDVYPFYQARLVSNPMAA